ALAVPSTCRPEACTPRRPTPVCGPLRYYRPTELLRTSCYPPFSTGVSISAPRFLYKLFQLFSQFAQIFRFKRGFRLLQNGDGLLQGRQELRRTRRSGRDFHLHEVPL